MLKDFKSEERYLNLLRKSRNIMKNKNKQYTIRLEIMKEKKEDNYKKKRNNFLNEYLKKQKNIERQLYKTRISNKSGWKKNTELMQKKQKQAKEKQKKKIEKDEKDRLEIENQLSTKSKKYNILFINKFIYIYSGAFN